MAHNVYVGMDIGTTNSCVSILYPNGSVKVVEDELGKRVIRSAVCFKEGGKRVVGYPAVKDIAAINTGNECKEDHWTEVFRSKSKDCNGFLQGKSGRR